MAYHNFTPIDIESLKIRQQSAVKKDNIRTVFLLLGIVTLSIIAVLLFVLIRQKLNA